MLLLEIVCIIALLDVVENTKISGGGSVIVKRVVVLICCVLLAAGCGPKRPSVAPPSGPPQQKTKAYQKPYTVMGKRYEPIQNAEGFTQNGVASWYGRDFHGKKTSNGETYNMNAMTAAHKTLPLGVFVRVHNKDNGRDAVVRVNDRGPFVKNRIIDLSFAAAKKLGVDAAGTANVRIEALGYRHEGPGGREEYKEPETYDSGNYTVQVGSFKEYANAQRLSEKLKTNFGYSEARLTDVNGELFYRVYAGKYNSLRTAESAEKSFIENGYPGSFVVSLD